MGSTVARPEGVKHSLHILLRSLIDYAGLFPPAGLDMATAVANYARYRVDARNSWALGRFIVPAARLREFTQYFKPDRGTWHLSALVGPNLDEDLAAIAEFNSQFHHAATIDSIEAKATAADEPSRIRKHIPENLIVYFEVALSDDLPRIVSAIANVNARAKVRTGGLTQEMFPSARDLVRFLQLCVTENVPFKATAGLHHPVRCLKPLTYEKDSPTGIMHGFLNVFLAAALLRGSRNTAELEQLLLDDNPAHFQFEDDAILWRGLRISHSLLLESRALAMSFGSCSFEEPMADLRSLNLL